MGIREGQSETNSLELLQAMTLNPQAAQYQHELQLADAKIREQARSRRGEYNGVPA